VRLLRRLPVITGEPPESVNEVERHRLGTREGPVVVPSHLLLDDQVYSLDGAPLVIGRSPVGPRTIILSEGLAGISRRHCTLVREGGEMVLVDHSSFGTYVNGERVAERVRLHSGDRVRIGDPGVEFSLIAVTGT
jgi:pSer/pThr/pTyr-binding forkhead associated (FHA) protein